MGNIEADKHAKETAYKIHKGYTAAPISVSIKTAFNLSRDIAMRSWQRMWDNDQSGRYTQSHSMHQQQSFVSSGTWHWNILLQASASRFNVKGRQFQIRNFWFSNMWMRLRKRDYTARPILLLQIQEAEGRHVWSVASVTWQESQNVKNIRKSSTSSSLWQYQQMLQQNYKRTSVWVHIRHHSSIIERHLPSFTMKLSSHWCFSWVLTAVFLSESTVKFTPALSVQRWNLAHQRPWRKINNNKSSCVLANFPFVIFTCWLCFNWPVTSLAILNSLVVTFSCCLFGLTSFWIISLLFVVCASSFHFLVFCSVFLLKVCKLLFH